MYLHATAPAVVALAEEAGESERGGVLCSDVIDRLEVLRREEPRPLVRGADEAVERPVVSAGFKPEAVLRVNFAVSDDEQQPALACEADPGGVRGDEEVLLSS